MAVEVDEEQRKGIDVFLAPACLDNVAEITGFGITNLLPGEVFVRYDLTRVHKD